MVFTANDAGKWNDVFCDEVRPFYCSRKKSLQFPPGRLRYSNINNIHIFCKLSRLKYGTNYTRASTYLQVHLLLLMQWLKSCYLSAAWVAISSNGFAKLLIGLPSKLTSLDLMFHSVWWRADQQQVKKSKFHRETLPEQHLLGAYLMFSAHLCFHLGIGS